MRKVSTKRARELRMYGKLRADFLEGKMCEAMLLSCQGRATEIHHKAGRTNERLCDESNFLAVCRVCHTWITEHSKQAIEMGLSKKR